MPVKLHKRILSALIALIFIPSASFAQTDGTYVGYSPYSVYGLGNMHRISNAWSAGMGGTGIAARNNRFINIQNPASITARDSLSFMADFGAGGKFSLFREGSKTGYNPSANLDDFVISFPMWKNTAFMAGITPFSEVGYRISDFSIDPEYVSKTFTSEGNGGTNQAFVAAAATFFNRLSFGVQGGVVFGSINKKASTVYSDDSHLSAYYGDSLQVRNINLKFGLQYEQPLKGKNSIIAGATYRISTPVTGYAINYMENGDYYRNHSVNSFSGLYLGDELGLGISYRNADVWSAEFNYLRSDWSNSNLESVRGFASNGDVVFSSGVSQSFRGGFEITPGRNDIRYYFRRCTYRAGAYYEQSYYTVGGQHVDAIGITLGMTLPVFRWYNGITIGIDAGKRGLAQGQISESFFGFNVGLNMFDIWFRKPMYE